MSFVNKKWNFGVGRGCRSGVMTGLLALLIILTSNAMVEAQFFNGFRQGVVGGVMIDAEGMARNATVAELQDMLAQMRVQVQGAAGDLAKPADRRMISLKQLQKIIHESRTQNRSLPEEVLFLGGLTRIELVFVIPDESDIVIAGPAENWKVSEAGSIVGAKSGRPVMYLDDLLVAFQSLSSARSEGISCSIDPTAEGIQRYEQVIRQAAANLESNPSLLEPVLKEAFGPQDVRFTGIPTNSHLARVLLGADYQMKRYGMELAQPPVKGIPSYLSMVRNSNATQVESRFWMACDYNTIQKSKDGLVWKIDGNGIKTLTEAELVDPSGGRKQLGKAHPTAQKWADTFTKKLDELSVKDPVFGELRNVMDLCVVAALIEVQGLEAASGCDLSVLRGTGDSSQLAMNGTPKTLPPQLSFVRSNKGLVVAASGGVMIDSFAIASTVELSDKLSVERTSRPSTDGWVW